MLPSKPIFIMALTLFLFACQPGAAAPEPTAHLPTTERGVHIRLHNRTASELASIELHFADMALPFAALAQDELSDYAQINQAYQSVAATVVTTSGETYTIEPLDLEAELQNPITSGHYTLILQLHNGNLQAEWRPEIETAVDSLAARLNAAGLQAKPAPVMTRGPIFDQLLGENITTHQMLLIGPDQKQVDIYLFPSAELAQTAASTIKFGGTEYAYTRPGGQGVHIFADAEVGALNYYWLVDNMLLQTWHEPIAADLTAALDIPPLYDPKAAPPLQAALANVSNVTLDTVEVTFPDGSAMGAGDLASGAVAGYAPVDKLYPYAPFRVTVGGETVQVDDVSYAGEAPLPDGRYTLAVDWRDGAADLAIVRDDAPTVDEALVGVRWHWVEGATAAGEAITPAYSGNDGPWLEFAAQAEPNSMGGLSIGGYTGCNSFFGSYFANGRHQIVITNIGQTEVGCAEPIARSEAFLTATLKGITRYERQAETLIVRTAAGAQLTFSSAGEEATPAESPMKGYEIFSWKTDAGWRFALVVATNRTKSSEEIMTAEWVFDDAAALVAHLQTLPAHTEIFWADEEMAALLTSNGTNLFSLPPEEIITTVLEGAAAADLSLTIEGNN